VWLKPGFHYPSWRPELTAPVDGWPVSITRQHRPCWRARVSITRQHRPCWRARVSTSRVDGPWSPVNSAVETGLNPSSPGKTAIKQTCVNKQQNITYQVWRGWWLSDSRVQFGPSPTLASYTPVRQGYGRRSVQSRADAHYYGKYRGHERAWCNRWSL